MANHVAAPLREGSRCRWSSRPPAAGRPGGVARPETVEDEAALVAEWVGQRRAAGPSPQAVLCRKRSQFAPVIDALERRDIPYEVVGLGGLLLTPEVEDIVALLHVVQDPSRGDQLMRLLTGPLCRLGAADLDGLMAWARHQQRVRRATEQAAGRTPGETAGETAGEAGGERPGQLSPGAGGADALRGRPGRRAVREQAPDAVDQPSIVEAVDDLPNAAWRSHRARAERDGDRPARRRSSR